MFELKRQLFGSTGSTHFTKQYERCYHHIVSVVCARHIRTKTLTDEERKEIVEYVKGMYNHIERELMDLGEIKVIDIRGG